MKHPPLLSVNLEKLLNLFSTFKDGVFALDDKYTIDSVNPAAVKLLNLENISLHGISLPALFPSNKINLENFLRNLNADSPFSDFRNYFPEYEKWLQFRAYPYKNEFSVFVKDISGQIQNEQILAVEREVHLMQATQIPLVVMVDHLLKGLEKIFPGYHAGLMEIDASGKFLSHLSSPSLPEKYTRALNEIPLSPNSGSCGTASFLKKPVFVDNIATDPLWKDCNELALSLGFISCWSFPVSDSNGIVMGSLGIYIKETKLPDTDEIKKLERFSYLISVLLEHKRNIETINFSNELYKAVLKATNDAIWDYNLTSNTMVWGNSLKELFGYDSELEPYTFEDWKNHLHPDERDQTVDGFMKVINSDHKMYWEDEYRFLKANGDYAYVNDRGLLIRNESGKAVRMVGAMKDITERKKTEIILKELNDKLEKRAGELQASNNELEKFAYIASHDLKEPLRMISSFLQLFESKYENIIDEKGKEYIRFAVDGSERMKELINDLLEYSRLLTNESGPEFFNPTSQLQEILLMFDDKIRSSGARITFSGIRDIYANRNQFLQLMQNLIGNALKYRSQNLPEIHISCDEDPFYWIFTVSDNGIGIEPEFHEKIFLMFQRLHSRNKYSGTGIGLAICKKIIEIHHGQIRVESQPGYGSSFIFTLPKNLI